MVFLILNFVLIEKYCRLILVLFYFLAKQKSLKTLNQFWVSSKTYRVIGITEHDNVGQMTICACPRG